jgi:polyisoprenoid-binding protein YceI
MRLSARCLLGAVALAGVGGLSGCPVRPQLAAVPAAAPQAGAHHGVAYEISSQASLLLIRVYRGGALAAAGHNHLIASHALSGTIWVPEAQLDSSFEIQVPLDSLSVDEAQLRSQEPPGEFPPDVPEGAKEGTRHNMLGPALLDAVAYPQIVLSAVRLEPTQPPQPGAALALVQAQVRGVAHQFSVPVHYELGATTLSVSGTTALKQSELGLQPFSAMLGALQVQDEMHISFRLVALTAAASAR